MLRNKEECMGSHALVLCGRLFVWGAEKNNLVTVAHFRNVIAIFVVNEIIISVVVVSVS